MSAPCCPDRAGQRGHPYGAHWFVVHDGDGAIDLNATAGLGGIPRSEVWIARSIENMCEEAGSPVRCGAQSGTWFLWDGTVYARQDAEFEARMTLWAASAYWEAVLALANAQQDEIGALPAEQQRAAAEAARKRWGKALALRDRMQSDAGQAALARALARACLVDESRLDAGTGEIVVDNGRISAAQILRDGYVRLFPHDKGKLDTRRCGRGVRYDPDARAPWFRRFLETSAADAGQRDMLLWRTANALFGRMPRKGFVNMIGERHSGKSTFTDLISKLAGSYASTVPVETFLVKHQGDSGFKQAELRGGRFVYTHEPNAGGRFDEGLMKTLTGRDRQKTAGKYEKAIEWMPQLTIFIGSNNPIRFATSDDAFMERQEVVSFARGYDRMDDGLAMRMEREFSGILNELLAMLVRESVWGTPPVPRSSVDARERMADETEDALEFLSEYLSEGRLIAKPDAALYQCVAVGRMYDWYRVWCDGAGTRPVGRKTFSNIVGRRYERHRTSGIYRFAGLVAR